MFGMVVLILLLGITVFTDLRYQKIYNFITIPGIILGIGINVIEAGLPGFVNSMGGFLFGFGVLFIVFLFGGMGGGDVKMMAAIGAIKGFPFIFWAICYSGIVGGIMAIAVMIWHGSLWKGFKHIGKAFITFALPWLKTIPLKSEESQRIPYGVAIAIGTVWALMMS